MGENKPGTPVIRLKPRGAAVIAAEKTGLIKQNLRGAIRKRDFLKLNRFCDEMEDFFKRTLPEELFKEVIKVFRSSEGS